MTLGAWTYQLIPNNSISNGTATVDFNLQSTSNSTATVDLELQILEAHTAVARAVSHWDVMDRQVMQAYSRALRLLRHYLNWRQRRQLKERGWFTVRTPAGHLYRIGRGEPGRIERPGKGYLPQVIYCLHPPLAERIPGPDIALTQKLLLMHNEQEFLREAHATPMAA